MMKVFLDTNVILEFFLDREDGRVASLLFAKLESQKCEKFMSAGSFYTMVFLVDKYLKKEKGLRGADRIQAIRDLMTVILQYITVADHDNESLLRGVGDVRYKDIEYSCQAEAAAKAGCNVIITFNRDDFPASQRDVLKVMTPHEYLA